jgi:hypothetical protein
MRSNEHQTYVYGWAIVSWHFATLTVMESNISSFLLFFFYWLHAFFSALYFHVSPATVLVLLPSFLFSCFCYTHDRRRNTYFSLPLPSSSFLIINHAWEWGVTEWEKIFRREREVRCGGQSSGGSLRWHDGAWRRRWHSYFLISFLWFDLLLYVLYLLAFFLFFFCCFFCVLVRMAEDWR